MRWDMGPTSDIGTLLCDAAAAAARSCCCWSIRVVLLVVVGRMGLVGSDTGGLTRSAGDSSVR